MTTDNGRYPRAANSAAYASTNAANGPDTRTPSTLLDGLAITASFSENKKDDDHQTAPDYADKYAAISPASRDSVADVGITKTSAYSWLCRRRHNHDLRHTFASHLIIDLGLDVAQVSRMLGHARITITLDIYTHLFEDARHARDIRTRMAASPFAGLLEPTTAAPGATVLRLR